MNDITDLLIAVVVFSLPALGIGYLLSRHTGVGVWEPVGVLAVVAVIFCILGLPMAAIPALAMIGLTAGLAVLIIMFLYFCLAALFSRRCNAVLVKVEVPEGKQSAFAYYELDGKVVPAIFGGIRKEAADRRGFVPGKECRVRYSRFRDAVFDRRAVRISICGLMTGVAGALMIVLPFMFMEYLP